MTTDGQKDFLTGHQGLGERTKADPEYNGRMTFANFGPKNLALSGEEKATTEPNGVPMLRPSPCSGPIQADYDYDYVQFTSTKQNYNATVRPKTESNKTFYNNHGLLPEFLLRDYKTKY